MSIETALIAQARPQIAVARSRALINDEVYKGCRPDISFQPVALEPYFTPLWSNRNNLSSHQQQWLAEAPLLIEDMVRLQVWIPPDQELDWNLAERFIKQVQVSSRIGFEVIGNKEGITISFLTHQDDLPILMSAFRGEFEFCELQNIGKGLLFGIPEKKWNDLSFHEYYPPPPYSHLLTRPAELQVSPFKSLIGTMSDIDPPALGLYQALFQIVSPAHNWHRNIEILLDIEYAIKLQDGFHAPQRYGQQSPSGDLHQMAWDVESKAHGDKPIYAAVLRVAVIDGKEKQKKNLNSLSAFINLFLHGCRPLNYITEQEYKKVLSPAQVRDMFTLGLTYRPGFILNSLELSGPVHIPPLSDNQNRNIPISGLETLPVRNTDLYTGTWIGTCHYAGEYQRVCLPEMSRKLHTHGLGKPGMGKTTAEEHMIMDDIDKGDGVAVIDPHGDLIERLLCLIPEHHVDRVIYLNPGDPDWVPIWNPLERIPGQDIGRMTEDIITAIKSFVSSGSWGDRLETIFRFLIFSLIQINKGTFLDISNLLRVKSDESKMLRKKMLDIIDNETARQFWLYDYEKYNSTELSPPKNKLSKLMISGTVSLMLSQPDSKFNFKQIMDEGMILLVNLSNIGSGVREVLGCFILSLLHITAINRSNVPSAKRKQFHIHCDEAHRFTTDALEDLIAETRKFNVSLNLAHQYMSQFSKQKNDAFSSVGSTIIFNVNKSDADYLVKGLRGLVTTDDLVSLGRGEAIIRIGTDIVRIKTRPPLHLPSVNFRKRIIEESRKKYYRPVHEIKKLIRLRNERWKEPYAPLTALPFQADGNNIKEFIYDEF